MRSFRSRVTNGSKDFSRVSKVLTAYFFAGRDVGGGGGGFHPKSKAYCLPYWLCGCSRKSHYTHSPG